MSPASKRGGRSLVPKGHRACPTPIPPLRVLGGVGGVSYSQQGVGRWLGLLGWSLGLVVGVVGLELLHWGWWLGLLG